MLLDSRSLVYRPRPRSRASSHPLTPETLYRDLMVVGIIVTSHVKTVKHASSLAALERMARCYLAVIEAIRVFPIEMMGNEDHQLGKVLLRGMVK